MALSLLTNLSSLAAQRNVNITQSTLADSVARLSSGMRINHASDDAAGLAISTKLTATLRSLAQASRNASDAVSMVQTAEGGMGEITNLLIRMRELAIESANGGVIGASERASLNTEFGTLISEIDRIVQVTTFNSQALLDGSISNTAFQVGALNDANNQIDITISSISSSSLGIHSDAVDTQAHAQSALTDIDTAVSGVASYRAAIGASQNRLMTCIDNLSQQYNNLAAANSRIMDTDVASETASLAQNNILLQAGISVLAQANQQPQVALQLLRG